MRALCHRRLSLFVAVALGLSAVAFVAHLGSDEHASGNHDSTCSICEMAPGLALPAVAAATPSAGSSTRQIVATAPAPAPRIRLTPSAPPRAPPNS